jgi:GNAT superfamily N-acetyltransferase
MVGRANDGLDFFPTPQSVADEMIAAAEIQEGMKVLEPSAGMGHIADQIRDAGVDPDVIELSGNRRELLEAKGHNIVAHDFMDYNEGGYDRIIMNPPFSDRRDAAHVQHAYDLLKPGGRLVAIMGEGVFFGSDKKASSFMDWLDSVGGEHEKMPENTFMDKSLPVTTGVNTRMVVIDKPLSGKTANTGDIKYSRAPIQSVDDFANQVKEDLGLKAFYLIETSKGDIELSSLIVDKGEQKSGKGTQAMERLISYADSNNKRLVLTPGLPNDNHGTTSRARLVKFYKKFGFVESKGRNVDYALGAGKMYRDPKPNTLKSESTQVRKNTHTKASLTQSMQKVMDAKFGNGWFNRLLATDKFKIIDRDEAVKLVGDNALFHKVWHGSPHDHNKFDSNKIGTGEGAQVFGYGHYFTDSEDIAKFYRDKLSPKTANINLFGSKKKITVKDFRTIDGINVVKGITKIDEAINSLDSMLAVAKINPEIYSKSDIKYATQDLELLKKINKAGGINRYGKVYEVELAPSQDEYLDWDKPISEQSALVKNAIEKLQSKSASHHIDGDITAKDIYKFAGELQAADEFGEGDKGSSGLLRSLGIRGIRYSAGSLSFGSSTDANNYVIFDDNDIEIVAKYSKDSGAQAFYNPANGTTYFVANNIGQDDDLKGLMLHEIGVHALQLGKNDAEFQAILKQLDNLKDKHPKIKAAYARIPADTKAEHRLEELAAYIAQESPSLPISKRIIAWFKNALRNIAKYLKGADRLKMMQWANRIDDADVVLMATKALKTAPDTLVLSNADLMNNGILRSNDTPDTIEVDGVQRPIVNSNGQQIHPTEEGIRNFWKWFGDSKIIDDQGRPLVVYHGTDADFSEFDSDKIGSAKDSGDVGRGFYFGLSSAHANAYAKGNGANVIPAYLNIRYPLTDISPDFLNIAKSKIKPSENKVSSGWDSIDASSPEMDESFAMSKAITETAKDMGHDGVWGTNSRFGYVEIVAFSPDQIKSAIGNDGSFNPENNDIRYSIGSPQDLFDDLAEIPKPTYKDLLDKFQYSLSKGKSKSVELGLSALTQSQLTQIGAEILPNLKQFGIERNHYDVEESTWHNRADKIAEKWEKLIPGGKKLLNSKAWKYRNKLEQMRLSEVMHEMTVSEIDPRMPEPVPNDKNAAAIKAHKDLKAKYDKLLPDTKKLLDKVDQFHQAVLDKLVDSLTDKITASEMPEENKERLVNDIKAKFKTQKGPYFPLMRFGSYWVDYDGGVLMFDSKKEQSDFIKKANDEGKIINGYGKSLKNFNKVEGVDAGFVDEVSGLIDDLDIEQAETLKDGIFQLYLSALPETSMRKRFIHRKKTPGWEQDALRSFSKKAFHDGKQLAKLQYAPAMRKVLADAEEIVKIGNSTRQKGNLERRIRVATEILDALDNGIEYDDLKDQYTQDDDLKLIRRFSRFTDEMDREKAIGDYLNGQRELLKAVEDYMKQDDPQELAADVIKALHKSYANMMESNTSPLTNLINQTVFTYFLGFNPASALINYFQTPGVALPVVAGRHGFAKASKELARAAKIFFTNTHSDDNSFSIQGGLTDAGEIMMYDALTSNGTFDRTRSHDLAGLSEEGIARGTLHRDLMQMSTFMFHKAEVANREITALMAYRLEYAKSGNRMQAIEYAADVVREAHLDYSSANRPDLFQGNAARIFLQFKMYSQGMTYLWGKTAWDSFKSKDPEKKRQARNTILSLIGVQTSMAGIMGLPIGGILLAAQALVSLMDDDDEPVDIEVEIRKALNSVLGDDLGRIAAKGALSETGADFSGRLSMSDLWIREPDKELEGKDASYYLLKTIAGPVAGIVEDIAVGMKLIGEGNTQRGMEKMLPHSVSGLAKAYRMIDEEGATSLTGNVIYETSAWEQAIQAMGMRPSGLAERQMQNSAIKNREMAITDTKSRLIAKAAQSRMKGDSEGYREAMQDIKQFNKKYPHLRITPASIVRSIKTRRANQRNAKDGLVVRKKLGFVREEESFI